MFVTTDRDFGQFVGNEKERVLPKDAGEKLSAAVRPQINVFAFIKRGGDTPDDLTRFVRESGVGHDGVVLVVEEGLEAFVQPNRDAAFTWFFEAHKARANPHNYLNSTLSRAFRLYKAVIQRAADAKFQQPMLLPLRNFDAQELRELRAAFHASPTPVDLVDRLDQAISRLRDRQSPKKSTSYKTVYFVDDREKHFHYGHEKHARPETGMPPHDEKCLLNSSFRFGVGYDALRHFNVSEAQKDVAVAGQFLTCHDTDETGDGRMHLNIFPCDQIA